MNRSSVMFCSFLLLVPRSHALVSASSFRRSSQRIALLHVAANEPQPTTGSASSCTTSAAFLSGDFCGHAATFTPTGRLIPVPEQLVPKALLEWGQQPSCLEVIVSETPLQGTLERHTVTVYPSAGCGVDNLDTARTSETIAWTQRASSDAVTAMDYPWNSGSTRTETTFALPNQHRLRFILDIKLGHIQSPLRLYLERQTLTESTRGTIADGGGLDGRTVSRLLGDELKTKFSDEVVEQANDGVVRLPRGLTFTWDGRSSLIIQYENQKIQRLYKDDGSVEIEVY
jgi:hypothetical protein